MLLPCDRAPCFGPAESLDGSSFTPALAKHSCDVCTPLSSFRCVSEFFLTLTSLISLYI